MSERWGILMDGEIVGVQSERKRERVSVTERLGCEYNAWAKGQLVGAKRL